MSVPKRELLRVLVEELAAQPEVLERHSSAHVSHVIMVLERERAGFRDALRGELRRLATLVIVSTCSKHGCPL